ncbi:MAG: transketolase [Geminicoccaceae bacterium]|nr:transketolase [Geminicoccaceae bacterium]
MKAKGNLAELERIATRLRLHVVEMVARTGQGYVQQGLGAADLFTALYFDEARLDPANPDWPERDRVILSTAHNTALLYATLSERGYFGTERLETYSRDGSPLELNASERMGSCVEATCGSLGQGLSVGVGAAAALRRQGKDSRVYVILGDGELQEGQVWEAMMAAGGWKLDNLCLVIDLNNMQVEGDSDRVFSPEPLADKVRGFGFAVQEIDGNDMGALLNAFGTARGTKGKPGCIIARTLIGKGVAHLEGLIGHMLRFPPEVAKEAIDVLKEKLAS